ncbi:transcription factor RFX4-like [Mizuhopecten yessoensis]|uniref:transcription factor RFX4-like n=1 Tax=Mizuhopecten yessoensis TaxID=6573 RepID=UPI000B45CBF0|nr:transcription factor RFX4-like [Mizuhopecten yessoensis]
MIGQRCQMLQHPTKQLFWIMGDLSYRLPQPQLLRLTLEDCAICLINRDDPFLFASPSAWKNRKETDRDADPETQQLRQVAQASEHKSNRFNDKVVLPMPDVRAQAEKIYRQVVPLMNPTVSIQLAEAWLRSHFDYQPHTSVARCDIYSYYVQYCSHISSPPCNHANFGKVVKTVFPRICTRRIGVRGNSKYHYYGIGPREGDDGPLVLVSSGKKQHCFVYEARADKRDNKQKLMKTPIYQKSLKSTDEDRRELLTLLEPAPIVNRCHDLPIQLTDIMKEFLALYRVHSLEILECVLVAHFYQVRDVIVEFWRKLPLQFITSSLMTYPVVMEAIVEYDHLTYRAICNILMPDPVQPTPSGLVQFVKDFVDNLDFWINEGLHLYPKRLREQKLEACRKFQLLMTGNLQLSWTATAARFVLHSHETVRQLQLVLQGLDVEDIIAHCNHCDLDEDTVRQYLGKFQQLLINNCALEEYIEWIETMILDHLHDNEVDGTSAEDVSKQLLLHWSYITGQILLQLTLAASQTLGSFHLLDVLFKDYAVYYLHHVLRL